MTPDGECILFVDDDVDILHSVGRALHQTFYRVIPGSDAEEAIGILAGESVGMPSNIGIVLVLSYFGGRFRKICRFRREHPTCTIHCAESELGYGDTSHADISAVFLSWRNFPEPLVHAALYHHHPHRAGKDYRNVPRALDNTDDLVVHVSGHSDDEALGLHDFVGSGVALRELEVVSPAILRDLEAHSQALYALR